MATIETRAELITIVVAMFDAAPGVGVLSDLLAASDAGNSNALLAASLANSTEFKGIFPEVLTNAEFVNQFVNQIVGSLVSESEKDAVKALLTSEMNAGATRVDVVLTAIASLKAVPESDPVWGNAAAAFNNKVEVATYHSVERAQPSTSVAELQQFLANVDNTEASVTSSKTAVDESAGGQMFSLTADATSADEGSTATFTLTGNANTTFTYLISGVDAADVEGSGLTRSVTTDASGNATISVSLVADRATEGAETLTVSIPNTTGTASVTVNDTSLDNRAPEIADATAIVVGEEAAAVSGQLTATDPDGDALIFALDTPVEGLTLNADGSFTFDPSQNTAAQALKISDDPLNITASVTVTDALGATTTKTVPIATVTPAPVTFGLTANATNADEGSTATFTLTGAPNTTFDYLVSGVDAADVDGGLTGTATTDVNGEATISVALVADRTTEGAETLTVSIPNTTATASVIVNDTSLDNSAPEIADATAIAVGEEAAAVTGQLTATDPDGDALTFALDTAVEGLTLNADGSFTFDPSQNTAAQALKFSDDPLNITASVTVTDALGATTTKTVPIATVTPAPLTFGLTANAASADEGSNATFTLTGAVNTTFTYMISGVAAADVNGALTGTATTDANGEATISVSLVADRSTEGAETLTVSIPNTTGTASVTINDTSIDNRAPEIADATAIAVAEGAAAVSGQLTATDPDGDALTFALDTAVEGLTLNADGSFTFDPSLNTAAQALKFSDDPLPITASVTVTDALGLTATKTVSIATVTPTPLTFTLTPGDGSIDEGKTQTYTVTASEAVTADTSVKFSLTPANGTAVNTGTNQTNTADFSAGDFNPETVVIAAGATTATFEVSPVLDGVTELPEAFTVTAVVSGQTLTTTGTVQDVVGGGGTTNLTTGIDNLTGTSGNDTFSGVLDGTAADSQINALDVINGGAGNDSLTILDQDGGTAIPGTIQISNVETINLRSAGAATLNLTTAAGITGVTTLNATQSTTATLTAAATTDINVSGATDAIDVAGGKNVSVTDATASKNIQVGESGAGTTNAAGTVSVTDSNQGTGTIQVDGGTDVTVTASSTNPGAVTTGAITVGANTAGSGAMAVTQNLTNNAANAVTLGNVAVTGGSTIAINVNSTNTASAGNNNNVTAGTYTATAGNATTEISVVQKHTAVDLATSTTGATKETSVITFGALAAGEAVLVGETGGSTVGTELTFTASKALTAAEVAAAFANLTSADTQASGGVVANGVFTGALDTGWTSGAANGSSVTFTATTVGNKTNLDVRTDDDNTGLADDGAAADANFKAVVTDGAAGTTVAAIDLTTADGAVVIDDNAVKSVTKVTVDGFNGATMGGNSALDSITNLTLRDGAGTAALTSSATSLALTLDGMAAASAVTLGATVATLNITASGSNSDVDLTATGVTTATVDASANLTLAGGTFANVETVTVTGSGNVNLGDISAASKTVTSSGSTGNLTATVDGTKATVTTGSGNDSITVDTADLSKNISLGAGNDTLTFSAATANVPTSSTISGGDGTDIISMTSASAQALDGSTNFRSAITGFEQLTISDQVVLAANADITIDLAALGFSYVMLAAGVDDTEDTAANTLILDKMASNGTLVIGAAQLGTGGATAQADTQVNVTDAASGTSDVFNLKTSNTAAINFGSFTVANVETVNYEADDTTTNTAVGHTIDLHTTTLVLDKATTVNVSGDANVTLTIDSDAELTAVNAGSLTGKLTYNADGTKAQTVTGGSGADALTASGSGDTLLGGAGNDTLTGASLTQMTGGAGNDTFLMTLPTNVNSYSTILDFSTGDKIDLDSGNAGTVVFKSAGVSLGDTAVFQDFANAAINSLGTDTNDAAWFQFGGNTYIVQSGDTTNNNDFQSGVDSIIRISGAVDLSTASYNQSQGTLELG